jgi:Ca-activated chloride channel family protein
MFFTFEHAVFLWFLALIPLLVAIHFYSLHFARQKAMRFANFEAIQKIVAGGEVIPKNYLLLLMRTITLVGFTLAASGITLHYETASSAYDYVIAIDSSSSMLSGDFPPSRMAAAREAASAWAGSLPAHTSVGVVEFSSQARVVREPTEDLKSVQAAIEEITPGKSGGTAICEALTASTNLLQGANHTRAIVLVSDGQNNAGCPLEQGIEYAKSQGVTIFSLGLGGTQGGSITGVDELYFTLDEEGLSNAAISTGGRYMRAENAGQLASSFSELTQKGTKMEVLPLAIPVMVLSFVFVFIDWSLSITRYRAIP